MMKTLKPLNQDDFKMRIIEDLGLVYASDNSKQKRRYAIFECTNCFSGIKSSVATTKKNKQLFCKSCASIFSNTGHGKSKTIIFNRWDSMKQRCYNKNNPNYKHYGAKGVTVCDEWINNFVVFSKWALSNGYDECLELDKDILCTKMNISPPIYSPETCLWIDSATNSSHKSLDSIKSSTGFLGVFKTPNGKYVSKIQTRGKSKTIGTYSTKLECAIARNEYIDRHNLPHTKNIV